MGFSSGTPPAPLGWAMLPTCAPPASSLLWQQETAQGAETQLWHIPCMPFTAERVSCRDAPLPWVSAVKGVGYSPSGSTSQCPDPSL